MCYISDLRVYYWPIVSNTLIRKSTFKSIRWTWKFREKIPREAKVLRKWSPIDFPGNDSPWLKPDAFKCVPNKSLFCSRTKTPSYCFRVKSKNRVELPASENCCVSTQNSLEGEPIVVTKTRTGTVTWIIGFHIVIVYFNGF